MNANTKFPNKYVAFNNKFGVVLPQVHNVIKPNQVPTDKPIEEEKEKEKVFTEEDNFSYFADMSFYSADDLVKYENSPIQNTPTVKAPQGVFDVYRYLKK
jgi:hypothetical protein